MQSVTYTMACAPEGVGWQRFVAAHSSQAARNTDQEGSGGNPESNEDHAILVVRRPPKTCEGRCEMKALVFDGRLSYRDDYPVPTPHQVRSWYGCIVPGISNTDIEITKGYMNHRGVLGHEFVGSF